MADMRDLALRHLIKAQRETLHARQIVAADPDLWRELDVAHGAVTDAIQAVNRIPVEEVKDDGSH